MEAVGLAIGVAGLAGLFTSCVEALNQLQTYKAFSGDAQRLDVQFQAERLRFQQWGREAGLEQGQPASLGKHRALDDPETNVTVGELLQIVHALCEPGELVRRSSGLEADNEAQPGKGPSASRRKKVAWALWGKDKRKEEVALLKDIVDKLFNLVPPGGLEHGPARGKGSTDSTDSKGGAKLSNEDVVLEVKYFISRRENERRIELQQNLQAWLLGPYSPNNIFDDAVKKKSEGTCDWILEEPAFKDWTDTSSPTLKILWINGPAGFGKTVLCASLAKHLSASSEAPVAKFFFSSDFESRSDSFVAVRHWTYQMAVQNEAAFDMAYEAWLAQDDSVAPKDTVDRLFGNMIRAVPGCTLVLDGLDECTSSTSDVAALRSIDNATKQAATATATRVLIVSRSEPDIRNVLEDMGRDVFVEYRLSIDDVGADIAVYSRRVVDQQLPNKAEDVRSDIAARMADLCQGQFLWVKLQADRLRRGMNKRQLQRAIAEAPAGLTSVYERNWELIAAHAPPERDRAFCLLRWAAFSLRPLTVGEITEAVLVREGSGEGGGDEDDGVPLEELPDEIDEDYINSEILGLCGSLIEVRTNTANMAKDDDDDDSGCDDGNGDGDDDDSVDYGAKTVHIAHFSVKEYLLTKLANSNQALTLAANTGLANSSYEAQQNHWLAKRCLRYVLAAQTWDAAVEKPPCGLDAPFRGYAAGYWYQHARRGDSYANEDMERGIIRLFDSSEQVWRGWTKHIGHMANKPDSLDLPPHAPPKPNRLHFASMLGLEHAVRHLLRQEKYDIEARGAHGWTPLLICCSEGFTSIASALLEAGASAVTFGNHRTTPLYLSSCRGHVDIMKLLLDKGADVNTPNLIGMSPVNIAACLGRLEAVRLLLDSGADAHTADKDGRSPLAAAAWGGRLEVMRLLVDRGCDVRAATEQQCSSLLTASERGHVGVTQFLLDKGSDVHIKDKQGLTPLHAAAEQGHLDVVKALLAHGADLRTRSNSQRTPLRLATAKGHLDVVRLLLEEGVLLDISKDVSLSLCEAAQFGRLDVIRMLLAQERVEVDIYDEKVWRPMHYAAVGGHTEILRLLHENGASLDFHGGSVHPKVRRRFGRTPVHLAASQGHVETLEYLLGHAVNMDLWSGDKGGWTPLSSAACQGHEAAVLALLRSGSDPDHGAFRPLAMAARYNHLGVMEALLAHGANVDGDGGRMNPLSVAAQFGQMEAVRLLLSRGADLDAAKKDEWNPVLAAESAGHEAVVKLLREHATATSTETRLSTVKAGSRATTGEQPAKLMHVAPGDEHIKNITRKKDGEGNDSHIVREEVTFR